MDPLRLLHLYPRELGINGDRGNVTALLRRAEWRGIRVEVQDHAPGDLIGNDTGGGEADLVHIGSGPEQALRAVYPDVRRNAHRLRDLSDRGVPFLAISAGWQLLGRELILPDGERLDGAGVFGSSTVLSSARTVGEVIVRSDDAILAGFENHGSVTMLDDGAHPLGTIVRGGGNTPDASDPVRAEGLRSGESIATHLHGPLLPMNPVLADRLLLAALRRRDTDAVLPEPAEQDAVRLANVDAYAARSREAVAARLGVRLGVAGKR